MPEPSKAHLVPGEIIAAAAGRLNDPAATAHWHSCAECSESVDEWASACADISAVRAEPIAKLPDDCPSLEELASFTAGVETTNAAIANHVIGCGRCAAILRDASDPPTGNASVPFALKSTTAAWKTAMATNFAANRRPSVARRSTYYSYLAAAAALLLISASLWWTLHHRSDPAQLLAQAYTDKRPFEYRLPDAGYSPIRQQRGAESAFDRPESLNQAQSQIQRSLSTNKDDPKLLALKGRAQLLERDYEGAIDSLARAMTGDAADPQIKADLACAYAVRGDVEKRALDYGHALDLFLQALAQRPDDRQLLFNIAIIYEKLHFLDQAVETWRKFLTSDNPKGWREEAKRHLDDIEKIRNAKKAAMRNILQDPATFVARYGLGQEFDPEQYLDLFWTVWLPRAPADANASKAARLTASRFRSRYGDTSLEAAMAESNGNNLHTTLAEAIVLNRSGKYDDAAVLEQRLVIRADYGRDLSTAMRARLDLAYVDQRRTLRQQCVDISEQIIQISTLKSWNWFTNEAHLIHAACAEALAVGGAARVEAENALAGFRKCGFQMGQVHALAFVAGLDFITGNFMSTWENAPLGLQNWWDGSAPPSRAQDLQYYLYRSAELIGWRDCAIALSRAALQSLGEMNNPFMESANRVRLAALLGKAGNSKEESGELHKASGLLQLVPPGMARDDLEWNIELELAELELAKSLNQQAMERISRLESRSVSRRSGEQMRLSQTRGQALVGLSAWGQATTSFKEAIEWSHKRAESMPTFSGKMAELERIDASYRNLTEIELTQQKDPSSALLTWCLRRNRVDACQSEQKNSSPTPRITYAVLRCGVAVWKTVGDKSTVRIVNANVPEIEKAARHFSTLCADPYSDKREIKKIGNMLFRWLIQPEIQDLHGARINLQTDLWLAAIPFEALSDGSGRYLSSAFSFVETTPVWRDNKNPQRHNDEAITRETPAFIISAQLAKAPDGALLPVLSGAANEGIEVARHFTKAEISNGTSATGSNLIERASQSKLFHFSGHGWSDGGNGGLILTPSAAGSPQFVTANELAGQNWQQSLLVVLSACLTATGEMSGPVNNMSLVRSFLGAGARTVVAARWSIDSEATGHLMTSMYDRLISGAQTPQALASAAIGISSSQQWEHPYYWAAFQVFSNEQEKDAQ